MLKKYTETFLNKLSVAAINFIIVAITANYLGVAIRGEISIFITNVSFIILLGNLLGGSAIAFYSKKINNAWLLFISLTGALLINIIALPFFRYSHYDLFLHLFFLTLLTSYCNNLQSLLIGKGNIRSYNYSLLSQPVILLIFIIILHFTGRLNVINDYLYALYISYIVSIIILFLISKEIFKEINFKSNKHKLSEVVKFSSSAGISNIIQFFNYRLNFYALVYFFGNSSVGLVSVAVSIAEGLWIIGNSISINLYSKLLNEPNEMERNTLTKRAFRISLWSTMCAVIILLLLPNSIYTMIFGSEFYQLKSLLIFLSPGIIFIGASNVIGYYFSATGEVKINNIKSIIGLISTIILSFLLIKPLGAWGACLAYSISYLFIFSWYIYKYNKKNILKLSDFILKIQDLEI